MAQWKRSAAEPSATAGGAKSESRSSALLPTALSMPETSRRTSQSRSAVTTMGAPSADSWSLTAVARTRVPSGGESRMKYGGAGGQQSQLRTSGAFALPQRGHTQPFLASVILRSSRMAAP